MAVFEFVGVVKNREDREERGTVVAHTEAEAKQKLSRLDLANVRLKRINGIAGLLKKMTADIK